jgi:DNA invertase Pin-like site-specific DNA recombinase
MQPGAEPVTAERVAIYVRCSTNQQSVQAQLDELRAVCARHGWQIVAEYADEGISGVKGRDERKGLDAMLRDANARKFHRVCVWSVDRLGRSLKHLVLTLEDLKAKGIAVYAHQQGLDSSTPTGMLMWSFLGIFSSFERDMIRSRVKSGMERAARNGKQIGKAPNYIGKEAEVLRLRSAGVSYGAISKKLGIGAGTVMRIAKENLS